MVRCFLCVRTLAVLHTLYSDVCAYFGIHFTVMLAAGAYRSIERGHCASLQRKGYKINQHLAQGARNTGTLHKHSWICQFSELDLCVCLPPWLDLL